jgi:hypothetical protein
MVKIGYLLYLFFSSNIPYDVTSVINEPTKFCDIKTQLLILCVMNDPVVVLSQVCFCVDQKSRMPIIAVWCQWELLLRWPIMSWPCRFKKSLKIPKGVIRIPKWKKDKQCNCQKKYDKTDKQWSTKHYTQTLLKTGGQLRCSRMTKPWDKQWSTEKYRLSNTNPIKNRRSTRVLPTGM